jgi:hypothetical protein
MNSFDLNMCKVSPPFKISSKLKNPPNYIQPTWIENPRGVAERVRDQLRLLSPLYRRRAAQGDFANHPIWPSVTLEI